MTKSKSRIVIVLAIIYILMFSTFSVSADGGISVCLDGNFLSFDVQPQIINGRTMVPMRKIFESLGAVVTWDETSQTVTGKKGDTIVNVSINSKTLFKNGIPKTLDIAPVIIESRTMVPVRAIAESFNCKVSWVAESKTVIISTVADTITENVPLSASAISEKVSPSVFYIEVYDEQMSSLGSGSGFFISSNGVAVTNYHVIEGSSSARITTVNGEIFNVSSVVAFDENLDVAIIKVNKISTTGNIVSNFSAVTLGNSDEIKAGQNVFALGSPVGLQNTISNGIISNVKQIVGEDTYIQITAPISHGSSGGALVNEYGEVLGITSAGIDDAQNIGFAIPINIVKSFDTTSEGIPYKEFALNNKKFTLEIAKTSIELKVGDSFELLVYAEGKGDWSIYWDTAEDYLVDCEWGDWLESNHSICPLFITAQREGVATITIYSDVDFKGKSVTVYIKKPAVETYPSSCVNVPTYTAITGMPLTDFKQYEQNNLYVYKYYNIDFPQKYVDYLLQNGFKYYEENKQTDSTIYYYIAPENKLICIVLAHTWNEVWIYIPRY